MKIVKLALLGLTSAVLFAGAGYAQTTGGSPNATNPPGNVIPAPSPPEGRATDPAANDSRAARVPTDPNTGTSSSGAAAGSSGSPTSATPTSPKQLPGVDPKKTP